ncbi:hypothetical protein J3R82DRAFT_2173 [Butyriboletus roseoflavus]|nr:hypothetical protein J3R82DRAFT_2173 [Butyriboletus roseoflavus]
MSNILPKPMADKSLEKAAHGIFRLTLEDITSWSWYARQLPASEELPPDTTRFAPIEETNNMFAQLLIVDHEVHCHAQYIQGELEGLSTAGAQSRVLDVSEEQLKWFQENLDFIINFNMKGDETNKPLHSELEVNIKELLIAMRSIMKTLADRTSEDVSSKESAFEIVNTEPKFHLNFHYANPLVLLTMLIAVILNIFGHLTHP